MKLSGSCLAYNGINSQTGVVIFFEPTYYTNAIGYKKGNSMLLVDRYELVRSTYIGIVEQEEVLYKNRNYMSLRQVQLNRYGGGAYADKRGIVWYTEIRQMEDIEKQGERNR